MYNTHHTYANTLNPVESVAIPFQPRNLRNRHQTRESGPRIQGPSVGVQNTPFWTPFLGYIVTHIAHMSWIQGYAHIACTSVSGVICRTQNGDHFGGVILDP